MVQGSCPQVVALSHESQHCGHRARFHYTNLRARGKMVKLFCAIVGAAGSAFYVDIAEDASVSALKEAIKNKKKNALDGVDPDDLQLFLSKTEGGRWLPDNDALDTLLQSGIDASSYLYLRGSWRLKKPELFGPGVSLGEDVVHVLVVVPEQQSASIVLTKKRKLADISDSITPSSFAKCKGSGSWVKWLKKLNGQIECHRVERPDDETPIPVVLLNKTFASFEGNCKAIKISQNDCEFVRNLCHGLSTPYDNEGAFAQEARQLLTAYLLSDNPASTITPATVNGSVSDGSYCFGETLLLNLECKLQKGDGGGDPTMQNVAYYIKKLPRVIDRQFPCFLVDICGPFMSVFGIVNTSDEDAICEPLVMSFPLLFFDNEWLMVSLARMCASLKAAVQELTKSCSELSASRQNRAIGLRSTALERLKFPYKDSAKRNGADVTFEYLEVVQRFVFKATHDGNNVIIKFAKRYGREVHEYCSSAGFAPKLLFYESLPNGWVFVVMEQLLLCPLRHADGEIVRDQLLKIKNTLKDKSFVHGDLREHNVMWDTSKSRVVLIDFDWSGRDGVDTYPPFMNAEIAWPQGAVCGKPLRVDHDAYWIASIAARLTRRAHQTLSAHGKPISSLSFSPDDGFISCALYFVVYALTANDNRLVFPVAADCSVKIWKLTATNELETSPKTSLYGHDAGVSAACWSPDSRHLASASDDRTARLWDVETAKTLATLGATHRSLDAALTTPLSLLEGSSAALGLDEDEPNAGAVSADPPVESHKGFVSCVAFNPQGSLVATGSHDENVRLWDVRSGKTVAIIAAHQEPVVSVQFHPMDGSLLVTGGYDGLVRVWDVASRQCLRTIISEPAAPVGSASFTPNGRYVLSSTLDGTLRLWDYMRDICVRSYSGHVNRKFSMQCTFLEQQWNKQPVVACGSEDNRIFMWDVGTQEVASILPGHDHPVLALSAHPTRALMVSGSNRDVKMWSPSSDDNNKTDSQSNGTNSSGK
ncbi:WD repeat-containing protein 5B [Phytophthora citrophthora]|uniref:WD repeat-containing protein 5B n=1 Tax=Phytophthora citrophthora TaxID=4793 RepID=A0AAD9G9M1_9STRA|nr:WD repeat-containing protein 5B [Phytophthora citrophthora]